MAVMIEQLSQQQGTGEITRFFPTGSAHIRQGSLEYTRLINFLGPGRGIVVNRATKFGRGESR